jgi:hypothetical protein
MKLIFFYYFINIILISSSEQKMHSRHSYNLEDLSQKFQQEQHPELTIFLLKIIRNLEEGKRRDEEERRAAVYRSHLAKKIRSKFLSDFLANRFF